MRNNYRPIRAKDTVIFSLMLFVFVSVIKKRKQFDTSCSKELTYPNCIVNNMVRNKSQSKHILF